MTWTQGESDSRTPDANRVHCHYAMGPYESHYITGGRKNEDGQNAP